MAAANLTLTVTRVFKAGRVLRVYGTGAIDASPATYTHGGLPIVWSGLQFSATKPPVASQIDDTTGYVYRHVNGTGSRNGKVKVFGGVTTATPPVALGEFDPSLDTTAIAGALSGASIRFIFDFDALQ